jgi:hypothetical protein
MRYAAEKRDLADSIAQLCEIADGRNDILADSLHECQRWRPP